MEGCFRGEEDTVHVTTGNVTLSAADTFDIVAIQIDYRPSLNIRARPKNLHKYATGSGQAPAIKGHKARLHLALLLEEHI